MSSFNEIRLHDLQDPSRSAGSRDVPSALVQQTLTHILRSVPFRSSKQSQHLLQYIVDQTLAGHRDLLKERLIGVNVFGRRPDYDTNEDPVVRARAGEVRKRLAQFYLGEGGQSQIRIEINPGSYHATFTEILTSTEGLPPESFVRAELKSGESSQLEVGGDDLQLSHDSPPKRRSFWLLLRASAVVGILMALLIFFWPAAPIDAFWKPFINMPTPTLLYSGTNPVYMLSPDFISRYELSHHVNLLERQGREFNVPISSDSNLEPSDLVGFKNDFTTVGDLFASTRIASLLSLHRKKFDLRCGQDVAFGDLGQSPTVLIGAFNNSLTMELTGDLPFIFDRGLTIRNQADKGNVWSPSYSQDGAIVTDYAIVTRMPHSRTGQALITIAGITQNGTRAAAEFITSPQSIEALVKSAPRGWQNMDMEIVLQTKIVNDIPTDPVPVASRYW